MGLGRSLKKYGGAVLGGGALGGVLGGQLGGMFGMGGGGGPKAPDPYAMADAQMKINRDAARMSMVNQQGPFGSVNYSEGPNGMFTATTSLDPAGQAAIGGARQMAGDRLSMFNSKYAGEGSDFSGDRQRIEDAMYSRMTSRLNPEYDERERAMLSRLEAQGITQGSEAFKRNADDFNRDRRSAYDEARQSAILGGGQEQSRMFDMGSRQRGQEWGEVGSLFNLGQLGNTPQAIGHAGIGSPDLMGAINNQYQGQLGAYSAKKQGQAQLLGGLLKLPLMFAGG